MYARVEINVQPEGLGNHLLFGLRSFYPELYFGSYFVDPDILALSAPTAFPLAHQQVVVAEGNTAGSHMRCYDIRQCATVRPWGVETTP
jgi:hypothetical protein